jgi:D-alanine-D-alanine ligase
VKIGLTFDVRGGIGNELNELDVSLARRPLDWSDDPFATADDAEEEFDSPETIESLADTLRSLGHEVELLGDGVPVLRRLLDGPRPDLVFNLAEGRGVGSAREARIPAVLEMLGIPYTGSDPLTLSVALDKDCAKRLVQAAGVATPGWVRIDADASSEIEPLLRLNPPWIIKPACEGSSKGILSCSLIDAPDDLAPTIARMQQVYRQPVLVEEFIDGDELTVGIVGNRPPDVLGVMRVVPKRAGGPFVYSLEVKRDWERQVSYECPAQLRPADTAAVRQAALDSWRALGCRDLGRIDFRLRDGVPYFLEANPLPGLSPKYSDLILMTRALGLDYRDLIGRIVQAAVERNETALAVGA